MVKLLNVLLISVFLFACNSETDAGNDGTVTGGTISSPAVIPFSIVNEFPHDTGSYTEGLTFYKGQLFEGTGPLRSFRIMELGPGR